MITDNDSYGYERFRSLVQFYYSVCPETVLPFLLLYLAKEGELEIGERARTKAIQYTSEEERLKGVSLVRFTKEDAEELAKSDPAGRHLLEKWECGDKTSFAMLLHYDKEDSVIQPIRKLFQLHDEALGESMERRRALFLFAQGLLNVEPEFLAKEYLKIVALLINECGLFPGAEDFKVSALEAALLRHGEGRAYYPFARAPYVSSLLPDYQFTNEFSGTSSDIICAVAELTAMATTGRRGTCVCADKALGAISSGDRYDLVVANRISKSKYDEVTFHYVLKNLKDKLSPDGIVIGLADMKDFFDITCRQKQFLEVVEAGKLARVILLPRRHNAVMIEIHNGKTDEGIALVNLFNEDSLPLFVDRRARRAEMYVGSHTRRVTLDDLKKKHFSIGEFFRYQVEDVPGMATIPMSRLISRIEKCSSSFGLPDGSFENLSEIHIDPNERYSPFKFWADSRECADLGIWKPGYFLNSDALITSSRGPLDARIFDADYGAAILRDGLAFEFKRGVYPPYLINELRKPYMISQLEDWTRSRKGLHSESEILELKIHCPMTEGGEPDMGRMRSVCEKELDSNNLPEGFEVEDPDRNITYTIRKALGSGAFGITYLADKDRFLSEKPAETVVLKEFFFRLDKGTERDENHRAQHIVGSIESIKHEGDMGAEMRRFISEAEKMMHFGSIPDSHIRRVRSLFTSPSTNNLFYEMDYYDKGTLEDVVSDRGKIPEKEAIEKYILPLAKALYILHRERTCHLDLKPENVLIDDDGFAVLSDFGVSKAYDEEGRELTHGERGSSSDFAPPEGCTPLRAEFHPEMDIYALGVISNLLVTGNTYVDESFRGARKVSKELREAIIAATKEEYEERTKDVMDFVHALPGCKDTVFEILDPVPEEDEPQEDFDFDFDIYGSPEEGEEAPEQDSL